MVPAFDLFVQVLQGPRLLWIAFMEFLKLLQTSYEIPHRVLGRVRVVAFPVHTVL
jgi:hypothetical protein